VLSFNLWKKVFQCNVLMWTFLGSVVWAQELSPKTETEAKAVLANMATDAVVQSVVDSTPEVYVYPNSKGLESVNYIGQTFRQVLLNDIKGITYKLKWGEFAGDSDQALQAMDSLFRYQRDKRYKNPYAINGNAAHQVTAKGTRGRALDIREGNFYSDIFPAGTTLQTKIAGKDNDLPSGFDLGWSGETIGGQKIDSNNDGLKTPEEFVDGLMKAVAQNAASTDTVSFDAQNGALKPQPVVNAAITPGGLDLAQLLQKFLTGAVSFSQAAGDYMSIDLGPGKGLFGDNSQLFVNSDGVERPFTVLEHHWDEAFGYLGMARDYSQYQQDQISKAMSLDSFVPDAEAPKDPSGAANLLYRGVGQGDAQVSIIAEKNFGMSVNAAKRDAGSLGNTNFAENLNAYFREGRQLITQKPEGYLNYVHAYSVLISIEWERVMASTAIHYINALQQDYSGYGTEAYVFTDLAKHFSEMKGFAMTSVYNPNSPMDAASYKELHELLGDRPIVPQGATAGSDVQTYVESLDEARDLLANIYGFTEIDGFPVDVLKGW